jgi:NAD(P)-dependent dehydrogenase (short-subunit alcohol dehydrogenase family)
MLTGMAVVVVGASGVLGRAFTSAAIAAGARVIAAGRRDPELTEHFIPVDVIQPHECDALADALGQIAGGIDVVANFTGVHHPPMALGSASATELAEEFARVLAVNLRGAFHLTAAAARVLVPQRRGHIIHLCSDASRFALEGSHAYVASKHGLEGLVKSAAAQLARYGVRVNGVAPGTVETPLNRDLLRNAQGRPTLRAASILAHTPTKRFATVAGVVESLLALCVPQRHLTGNLIFCDDGYAVDGHSWPEGTRAVYDGPEPLAALLAHTGGAPARDDGLHSDGGLP